MIVLACGVGVLACTDDAAPSPPTPGVVGATDAARATSTPPPSSAARTSASGWTRITPGGDCQCSDGSEFSFWVRRADPTKVVLFLQGGGFCFDEATCAPGSGAFTRTIADDDESARRHGVFDTDVAANPFRDHSVIVVPYCTGDAHLGDTATTYGPGGPTQHRGAVNAGAAVDHLVATLPGAVEVAVLGESAGAVPAPVYAGVLAERLPRAHVVALADGAGSYPDDAAFGATVRDAWGLDASLPPWPELSEGAAATFGPPALFVAAGRRHPEITMARRDVAHDAIQQMVNGWAGIHADDLPAMLDRSAASIEDAGVPLATFVAPGRGHTILSSDDLFREEVAGVGLADWIASLAAGRVPADVRCVDCD